MTRAPRANPSSRPAVAEVQSPGPVCTRATKLRSLQGHIRHAQLCFFLQRIAGGVYVEREEIPRRGLRTLQSVHFADAASFERWCDGDPVRFQDPLLHVNLKREGDELFRIDA
jgi:hypothetical protein